VEDKGFTRRKFMELGCMLGASALLGSLGGCSNEPVGSTINEELLKLPLSRENGRVLFGIYSDTHMRQICEEIVPRVSDMKWLSRGDSIFIKVASNSPNRHPATTSPRALKAIIGFLKDRGAGTIYVGDQSGTEFVRLTADHREGSTRHVMKQNGLLTAAETSGAQIHCFDDQGWDGYFRAESDFDTTWKDNLFLPKILQKVDHIINLPRLGRHSIAGYTCGIKNAVGWLRDDSRRVLHLDGPTFFQKIADINHFPIIRKKLRFTLTLADSALLKIGPDFGGEYDFGGYLVLASSNLVDHDFLASSLLPWLDAHCPSPFGLYATYPKHINYWNRLVVKTTWGEESAEKCQFIKAYNYGESIAHDTLISHMAYLQKYRPAKIAVLKRGDNIPAAMMEHIERVGEGIFRV